jgi:hypothetical protein
MQGTPEYKPEILLLEPTCLIAILYNTNTLI